MDEPSKWLDAVIRLRQPMEPLATDVVPSLKSLSDIRAVVFDIYGTLVISGSGDVGSADATDRGAMIHQALAAVGCDAEASEIPTIEQLQSQIRRVHEHHVSATCPKPEVDIIDIWRATLAESGLDSAAQNVATVVRLAAEYEARANPTWPMPGATDLLSRLAREGLRLGIVSNAQEFTLPLVEKLTEAEPSSGLDLDLCFYSYRYRQAKPGPRLFDALREGLQRRGISPQQAVYVGNDMLNDVWAASQAGLKTAWFAGDARSCRPRSDEPRCRSLRPDVVLTNLMQLLECLDIE